MLFSLFHSHNNHYKVVVLKYRFVSTTISNTLFCIFIHFVLGKKSHEIHTISFHNWLNNEMLGKPVIEGQTPEKNPDDSHLYCPFYACWI